ncbi:MAG: alpha/beta hydrolase [Candidatus Peribacteria bacterium]|nr:MAG: alpha/beta hydrolase [Candidatus Peribacteria bacterium]
MKQQVIFIRGGEAFDTKEEFYHYLQTREFNPFEHHRNWRDWIAWALSENYDAMTPVMPNKQWADYTAWKIWFERHLVYLNNEPLILIGHSLGATFLLKYLSENNFPKIISQLHIVSPVHNNDGLASETISTFELDDTKIPNIESKAEKIFLYHSKDDPVVPFHHGQSVAKLLPNAQFLQFENRLHFNQPAFPELLENINNH